MLCVSHNRSIIIIAFTRTCPVGFWWYLPQRKLTKPEENQNAKPNIITKKTIINYLTQHQLMTPKLWFVFFSQNAYSCNNIMKPVDFASKLGFLFTFRVAWVQPGMPASNASWRMCSIPEASFLTYCVSAHTILWYILRTEMKTNLVCIFWFPAIEYKIGYIACMAMSCDVPQRWRN